MELIDRSLIGRTLRHLGGQTTARSNAADASATLRNRRREREEVEAFLHAHWGTRLIREGSRTPNPLPARSHGEAQIPEM